ncbi:hypothetical protein BT96DRAFT_943944 [Gymnopus androsaceus JB14]|uniref:Uncharacterized protein n=1 Tax=Gymnopus androsaceus JB14 TaxID=1447944 RepID=A0A6A4H6M9_9AGAR|nr:hypothetical protein BT96DRAFT_943944 [Gymnopus androsaceus JB14]
MTYLEVLNLKMVIKQSFYTEEVIPEYFHTPLEDSNYKEQALSTIDPHVGSKTGWQITVPENPRWDGHGPNTTVPSTITDGYGGMPYAHLMAEWYSWSMILVVGLGGETQRIIEHNLMGQCA